MRSSPKRLTQTPFWPHKEALTNIDGIIAKSEALMVARGDLGVELELERVPFAQKLLIRKAKELKPCGRDGVMKPVDMTNT